MSYRVKIKSIATRMDPEKNQAALTPGPDRAFLNADAAKVDYEVEAFHPSDMDLDPSQEITADSPEKSFFHKPTGCFDEN